MSENSEANYLLGFLACDGCFSKNGTTIDLQLQQRDAIVLRLFCKHFKARMDLPRTLKGRTYLRARAHGKERWAQLVSQLGGPGKELRRWPADANDSFVAGCLDADGCFYLHAGRQEGEFQHCSSAFRNGFFIWLANRGMDVWQRTDRPILYFPTQTCRKLAKLWPDCGLTRKRDIAALPLVPHKRWWTPAETAIVSNLGISLANAAKLTGKSYKSVQLKRWRYLNATCT